MSQTPESRCRTNMKNNAQRRAERQGVYCSLRREDVVIPERCPVCERKLNLGGGQIANRPCLDLIVPGKPFTGNNVWVLCHTCDRRKADSTPQELRELATFVYQAVVDRGLL